MYLYAEKLYLSALAEVLKLSEAAEMYKKEAAFLNLCKENGMIGVKGYRTVGGIRVSMYNAMPMSSVAAFCDLMKAFN